MFLQKIKKHLSYRIEGVEYTEAYKNGWNGITYLISDKGLFSLGLIENVKIFIKYLHFLHHSYLLFLFLLSLELL